MMDLLGKVTCFNVWLQTSNWMTWVLLSMEINVGDTITPLASKDAVASTAAACCAIGILT